MLENNCETRHADKNRKHAGQPSRGTVCAFTFSVILVALFPIRLAAQTTSSGTMAPGQASALGTGVQTPLRFAGESESANQVSLSIGASTFYDDNVLARNSNRVSDEALSFTSHLGIARETEHLTVNFDYNPFFQLYRQIDQYDRLNHVANLGLTYRLTSSFSLGLHDSFSYQNGIFPPLAGQQIMSGPASPSALNQMIFSYTTRTLSNAPGMDLTFVKSRRTSLTLSGGYNQRQFGNQGGAGQALYNSRGVSGGVQFQYRVTDHTTLGLLLNHQDTTYQGSGAFGNRVSTQIESPFLSVESRLSPTVTVTVHGGPQYVRTLGGSGGAGTTARLQGAGGGNITKEVRKTALTLSFQRSISDSGGLYTSVINTNANFGVRRRLVGRWEANLRGGGARADASLFKLANGSTDALTGGIDISRPVRGGSVFHLSYETTHELSKGTLPIAADFDRNQVTIGFDYRLKTLSLGR